MKDEQHTCYKCRHLFYDLDKGYGCFANGHAECLGTKSPCANMWPNECENSKFKIMTKKEAIKHVEDVSQSVGAIINIMTAATGGTKNMTIDQAVEWLLNDPKRWNNGKMPPSQVTELRRRYRSGALKTNAKLNLIRRSEMFDEFIRFDLKNK